MLESLGTSPGALPSRGPGFPVGMPFPKILGVELGVHSPARDAVLLPPWSMFASSFSFSSSTFFRFPYSPSTVSSSIYSIHSPLKDTCFLAALGHSCGMCRIFSRTRDLAPWPGIRPRLLQWKCRVLATGPPGKSPIHLFQVMIGTTIRHEFLPRKSQRTGSVLSK